MVIDPATAARRTYTMDRRRFLLASMGGLGALALGACSPPTSSQQFGRTLRLPQGALGFPSPFAANADPGYNQMSLVYDSLLWKDGSGELLPWLAESFESSPDHLTYTFTLRDNLRWGDGRPLTADDVVFTFDYYAKQQTLSPPILVQPPQGIAKVTAPGPTTVVVTLESPTVTFPEMVAGAMPIIPRHVWSSIKDPGGVHDRKVLVGSGPYRVDSYRGDSGPILFTAKPDYFLGSPFVKRIEENGVEDIFGALLADATDAARGIGLRDDTLAPFKERDTFGIVTEQGSTTNALYWNLGREGPLADVRFRKACAMAIDRNELVTRLSAGRGRPGNPGFLGPDNPFHTTVPQYQLNIRGANALLDAAGYRVGDGGARRSTSGKALRFVLRYNNLESPLAEILIGALKRIGVEISRKPVEVGAQLFGPKFYGGYDMIILPFPGPGPGGPNADPDVLRRLFSSRVPASLQGATAYANPALDDLADLQLASFDPVERKALVAQMQRLIANDLPVLPLYYPETSIIFRKRVLPVWYFTPGQFPSPVDNKQLFVTGMTTGTKIRSAP